MSEPSVFLVSLPKSGTDFTNNALQRMAGLRVPEVYTDADLMGRMREGHYPEDPRLIGVGNFDAQIVSASGLRRYADGGYILSVHMHASHYNIRSAQEAGFRRMTVLMRDPRDATVSMTYHLSKAGPDLRRLHSEFQFVPPDYFGWSHAEQIAFQLRVFLPRAVNWIEGWLGAFADGDPALTLNLACTDDLKGDAAGFMAKLLRFHGLTDVDAAAVPDARAMAHFRSGEHGQWRHEFSEADQAFAEALIGPRLTRAFSSAAAGDRDRRMGLQALHAGDGAAAASRLLACLRRFPTEPEVLDELNRALALSGIPLPDPLKQAFEAWQADGSVDRLFQRPHELLAQLADWLESAGARPSHNDVS